MARPAPRTWSQVRLFWARNPFTPWINPLTTASVPIWEFVELWRSLVEMMEPSAQTPPVFDVVAPLSVPINTPWIGLITYGLLLANLRGERNLNTVLGSSRHQQPANFRSLRK